MLYSESEIMDFVEENDVKFIRLAFCDVFGEQKNISILPHQLRRAFTHGISFDASAIAGFGRGMPSDLLLIPDPTTIALLPWRPSHGRVMRFFCDIHCPDGTPFSGDSRYLLKAAIAEARKRGYVYNIGAECEFYLFKMDECGRKTDEPFDNAGYMDIAPEDKGENVRREICLTLEEMGINPESSHHDHGPGQNEIDFGYGDALKSADDVITFKTVVRTIAAQHGLYASFAPKPLPQESGNGFHINLSLNRAEAHQEGISHNYIISGILAHIRELTAFLNPCPESYARLGNRKAPKYISWGEDNRSLMLRIPASTDSCGRVELRSPDTAANPYLAYALLIYASIDAQEKDLPLPAPTEINLDQAPPEILTAMMSLPQTFDEAIAIAEDSTLIRRIIPKETLLAYKGRIKAGN